MVHRLHGQFWLDKPDRRVVQLSDMHCTHICQRHSRLVLRLDYLFCTKMTSGHDSENDEVAVNVADKNVRQKVSERHLTVPDRLIN